MTCRAHLVRRSSRPYDAEAEAAVSCLSFVLDAWRREKQAGSAFKNRWRVDPCLSNCFSRSNASSLDRPWRRENTSGKMVGPRSPRHPASRQTNHDETTVFPRPQRETRERYAPATTTMTRPPTSTGIYPTVSARSPARRDRSRRVSLTLPPPPADDAQNTERPRREIGRPRTMLIDNFTVKSPNVTYTDEHIESTYTCVRQPDFPRDGSRRASPSHTAPVRVPVRDFRHVSVGRDFVSDRPPSFFHALTEIVASSARAGTTTRS